MMKMDREPLCPIQDSQQSVQKLWSPNFTSGQDTFVAPKVHVNPNFKSAKSLVIHVNPRMHQTPMVHVNPKMIKDILPLTRNENPQFIGSIKLNRPSCQIYGSSDEASIQKSIHINPKLMEKLSSIARADIEATSKISSLIVVNDAANSGRKEIRDGKTTIKSATPQRLLTISRRKLVRIGANNKVTENVKSSNTMKICYRTNPLIPRNNTKKSTGPNITSKFAFNKHKNKISSYKIDRTTVEHNKLKKVRIPDFTIRNGDKGLVAIGGVMYQSTRTRLVRSSTGSSVHKKKKSIGNPKIDTFVMAKNGKKLHRLSFTGKDETNVSRYAISRTSKKQSAAVKRVPNSIAHSSHKNVISYKAKQRSLQILRDKLRKNYVPCLIFRRFGYCANHAKGTCSKLHDKKQVALCRNFLQGKCLLDECPMSHDIGPEKMPTCKYFLEGCCIRDACPYLHVKVSSNTPLCAQFLRGYCAEGSKCKQRHAYICPGFEKTGKCSKGKHCPYPHKLKSAAAVGSLSKVSVRKKSGARATCNQQLNRISTKVIESGEDSRKRYYDNAGPSDEQLVNMRESILKQMKHMNPSRGATETVHDGVSDTGATDNLGETTIHNDEQKGDGKNDKWPKRPPLGPLPAYIPIN